MAIKVDMELQANLKLARRLEMHFVFCPGTKLEEHYLALSKRKLTKSDHAEARLESDGTKIYFGVTRPEAGSIVFLSTKEFPSSARKAMEKTVRQKAGLKSLDPRFRTSGDADEADEDGHESRRGLSMNMRKLYARKKAVLGGVKKLRQRLPAQQAKKIGRAVLIELNKLNERAEQANAKDDETKVQNVVREMELLEKRIVAASKSGIGDTKTVVEQKAAPQKEPPGKPWELRVKEAKSRLLQVQGFGGVPTKTVDQLTRLLEAAQAKSRKDAALAAKLMGRFEKEAETAVAKALS